MLHSPPERSRRSEPARSIIRSLLSVTMPSCTFVARKWKERMQCEREECALESVQAVARFRLPMLTHSIAPSALVTSTDDRSLITFLPPPVARIRIFCGPPPIAAACSCVALLSLSRS